MVVVVTVDMVIDPEVDVMRVWPLVVREREVDRVERVLGTDVDEVLPVLDEEELEPGTPLLLDEDELESVPETEVEDLRTLWLVVLDRLEDVPGTPVLLDEVDPLRVDELLSELEPVV